MHPAYPPRYAPISATAPPVATVYMVLSASSHHQQIGAWPRCHDHSALMKLIACLRHSRLTCHRSAVDMPWCVVRTI